MRALSTRNDDPERASRPFDAGRDGFVVAEGSGVLVLEELRHAQARGATILGELIGYGATADASHITLPAPGGMGAVRAARRAMEKAGVLPEEIDHLNAHATSTPEGDKAELQAIRTIFGDHAPRVAVSANKSMLGHTLGAAGAIEAIATIQAMRTSCIPPTINLDDPDAAAEGLDLTPGHGRQPGGPPRDQQLVRVRRPEHGPGLQALGRMTDDLAIQPPSDGPDADLLGLIDRLAELLDRSDLTEIEVESGGTGIILRKPGRARRGRRRGRCRAGGSAGRRRRG